MKIFFYVQHLLGIGHLRRAATLGRALADAGFEVSLVSGGVPVRGIAVGVQLPPASAADLSFKTLLDEDRQPIDEAWKRRRAAALLNAWRASRADVLMVELFPFGRRQMRFELMPLLEDAQRLAPRPLVVCSVRDLLQSRPERETETAELAARLFDHILETECHMNVNDPGPGGNVRLFTKVAIASGKSSFILPPPLSVNQPIERRAGPE